MLWVLYALSPLIFAQSFGLGTFIIRVLEILNLKLKYLMNLPR